TFPPESDGANGEVARARERLFRYLRMFHSNRYARGQAAGDCLPRNAGVYIRGQFFRLKRATAESPLTPSGGQWRVPRVHAAQDDWLDKQGNPPKVPGLPLLWAPPGW